MTWYSRTDAALVGTPNLPIEIRYNVPTTGLVARRRITQGTLCGTTYVRGNCQSWGNFCESGTVNCPGAPITVEATQLITLQGIYPWWTFLMVGEVEIA